MAEKEFSFRRLMYRHSLGMFFIPSMIYGGDTTFFLDIRPIHIFSRNNWFKVSFMAEKLLDTRPILTILKIFGSKVWFMTKKEF